MAKSTKKTDAKAKVLFPSVKGYTKRELLQAKPEMQIKIIDPETGNVFDAPDVMYSDNGVFKPLRNILIDMMGMIADLEERLKPENAAKEAPTS